MSIYPAEPLTIVQVSPFAWEDDSEAGSYVAGLATALAARGHRLIVACPSHDDRRVRAGHALIKAGTPGTVGEVTLVAISDAFGFTEHGRASIPIAATRSLEALLSDPAIDICHLHEPFAPSVASVALRTSRALNVGTFHAPTERLLSTQLARKLVTLVFGRLDSRQATSATTATLIGRFFPAEYQVVAPGAAQLPPIAKSADEPTQIVFIDGEERAALRTALRALRLVDENLPWQVKIVSDRAERSVQGLHTSLRRRVSIVAPSAHDEVLAAADIVLAASAGSQPRPGMIVNAVASQALPIVSDLPIYEPLVAEQGLLFPPGEHRILAAQIARALTDDKLRTRLTAAGPQTRSWDDVAAEVERGYRSLTARRHDTIGKPQLYRRLRQRPLIDIDMHMHTDHSGDCATPVEHLLATARAQQLGAIAVTDHNVISGALEAQAKCDEYGIKVIVGEEVKTKDQGEVIGLFLTEQIPRGLTLEQTVAEIRRQGGIVYVPHPFDRMHSVPDYEHLAAILDEIDAIEVYNPRVAIGAFNEEAERFAAKYRIVRGAGSDSHVAAGLGSVRVRMHDFDGPEEFLESLRHAEIQTKSGTLLYVQALKFLETKATPAAARKVRKRRLVRRAQLR